ncbi:MAG TPA: tyrosinase family protein [Candidatus Eremiobacteraceae bacterium]|nr:tyrosinase family protein [Candidatus Eremiobacteraceae bacterium]
MQDTDRTILGRRVTRRRFLTIAGTSAVAVAVTQPLFSSQALAAPLTRFDVGGLTATSPTIKSFIAGIKAMRMLPKTDPTSWQYQAAIHGYAPITSSPPTAWGTCQHGNEFFWSWHRMYLYWFERIVRKKSGDSSWTIPFWAWDSPSELQIPALFREKKKLPTLYSVNRLPAMNAGAMLTAVETSTTSAFMATSFWTGTGSGAVEQFSYPHNHVHVAVGAGFADPTVTALDPLFWLHHSNCDRLWEAWRGSSGGSDPTSDLGWTGKTWTFFDENGKAVTMSDCDVVNAAQQLKYRYQGGPTLAVEMCPNLVARMLPHFAVFPLSISIPPLGAQPVRVPLQIPADARQKLMNIAADPSKTVYLHLEDVTAPTQPGAVWAAFVGPPSAPSAAVLSGAQPADAQDPYFVGAVSLFVNGVQDEMDMRAQVALPLNKALLASRNASTLEITFVTQGVMLNGVQVRPQVRASVNIGKATILVETHTAGNAKSQ